MLGFGLPQLVDDYPGRSLGTGGTSLVRVPDCDRGRALTILFDFSLAADELAGPRTVMDGLLAGWAEAYPEDKVSVFGPPSLQRATELSGMTLVAARAPLPPRRIVQQQAELPLRGVARRVDAVVAPNLTCSIVGVAAPIIGTLCDLRHLRRPKEFSAASRVFRRVVWTASARRMSGLVSISEFSLREAGELRFPLPRHRAVAPLGLDHVRRDPRVTGKGNTVVCVSHRQSKGLEGVPSIWSNVQARLGAGRPELVITGVSASDHKHVTEAMAAAGVVDGFRVTDFLPTATFQRTIAEAKALLYLSPYEGYGFVPSEATALGTHSFVYDLPPYRERALDLSVTAVPVGETGGIVRELVAYLRSGCFDVAARPVPTWADTARAYRALISQALQAHDAKSTSLD